MDAFKGYKVATYHIAIRVEEKGVMGEKPGGRLPPQAVVL